MTSRNRPEELRASAGFDPDEPLPDSLWRPSGWRWTPEPVRAGSAVWLWVIVLAVAAYNPLLNLLLPDQSHVVANLLFTALLVAVAIRTGATWDNLGLRWGTMARGAVVGLVVMAVVAVGVTLVVTIPATREFFADDRFIGLSTAGMAYEAFVRIPLGTVVFEETVFRGVLLGLFLRRWSVWKATLAAGALFGLWHAIPALDAIETNPAGDLVDSPIDIAVGVGVTIAFTAAVGCAFAWLRFRGNSLITPVMAHIATNSFGFIAGWLVVSNAWS